MITPRPDVPEVNLTADAVDSKALMLADLEVLRDAGYNLIDQAIEEVNNVQADAGPRAVCQY